MNPVLDERNIFQKVIGESDDQFDANRVEEERRSYFNHEAAVDLNGSNEEQPKMTKSLSKTDSL